MSVLPEQEEGFRALKHEIERGRESPDTKLMGAELAEDIKRRGRIALVKRLRVRESR
jgi:hypothetical protein